MPYKQSDAAAIDSMVRELLLQCTLHKDNMLGIMLIQRIAVASRTLTVAAVDFLRNKGRLNYGQFSNI